MKYIFGTLLILFSFSIFGGIMYQKVIFKQNVSGYLKRAADANTLDLAAEELGKAIQYLEANNLTTGYTSILWQTPDEDIDFWYRNLKASQNELLSLDNPTPLEKTNTLIKLRETLVDHGEKLKVTVPRGLSRYPHNGKWAIGLTAALTSMITGIAMMVPEEKRKREDTPVA